MLAFFPCWFLIYRSKLEIGKGLDLGVSPPNHVKYFNKNIAATLVGEVL